MEAMNAVFDLNLKKLTILLISILTFTVLFVLVSRDFIQWSDFSSFAEWTKAGGIDGNMSCLSRTHQQLYRAYRLAPASPKLMESWQRYVEMHRSCSGSRNWAQMLAGNANSSASAGSQECKFLFYVEGGEGLGNRFLSLMSAMLYALLTDRVLMIDSRGSISKILCEPFAGSSWVLPHDFPYEQIDAAPPLGVGIEKRFTGIPVLHLKLFHIQSGGDKSFFCDEYQERLNSVKLLAWSSNQYFVTSFFTVPVLWKKLVGLFPGPRLDVAAQIAQLMILPANDVWSLIVKFHDGYLACSKTMVGVQIRPHGRGDLTGFDPVVSQIVYDCLMHHQLLPRITNSTALDHSLRHETDVSVLVASLQGKYYESLRNSFLDHDIEGGKVVSIESLSHEGFEQHNLHQARLALAEMWLLSFSDRIVTSEYSTFGYIAHGVAGLRPRFLRIKGTGQQAGGDGCYLSQSTEPCTQFPQEPSCATGAANNSSTEHQEWIRRNIRACQDHPVGFQLLN